MKKILVLTMVCLTYMGFGQIKTPAASPSSTVEQSVGLSTFTVEYSRPGVKDRVIFAEDGLVPFGKKWRAGANAATKLTFSDEVMIGDGKIDAGSYALLITPNAETWDFHLYTHTSSRFGTYLDMEPALSYSGKVNKMGGSIESYTISFQNVKPNGCTIDFLWDDTWVQLPVSVEVDAKVMASIEKVMAGPSSNDYFQAATYYHTAGKDLNVALEYITKATDVEEPKFWQVRRKALILADLGKMEDAVKTAELSMMLAEKAGNDDYVRLNKKSIKEWTSE